MAKIRNARLRALRSDTATIEHVREQECAAMDRAQAAEPEARGPELRSDLAPFGRVLITNWTWIEGTLRVAGESAFAPGKEDTDWRSCWQTLARTSEDAEVSLTACDGEGIDALLRAAPRKGDVWSGRRDFQPAIMEACQAGDVGRGRKPTPSAPMTPRPNPAVSSEGRESVWRH